MSQDARWRIFAMQGFELVHTLIVSNQLPEAENRRKSSYDPRVYSFEPQLLPSGELT